jgi:hypothetical protein
MFKWIVFGIIGFVMFGLTMTNGFLTQVIASKNHGNTSFLIAEYKDRPNATVNSIKRATALCVKDQVGQNIPALNKLFGEMVVYMVKNLEKDESEFYQGMLKMLSKQERAFMAVVHEASPAKEKAITKFLVEFQQRPFTLMNCVAGKIRKPATAA